MTDQAKPTGTASAAARKGAGRSSFRAGIPEKEHPPHAKRYFGALLDAGNSRPSVYVSSRLEIRFRKGVNHPGIGSFFVFGKGA